MTQKAALDAALKSVVQTMSKKKQTSMIADYAYNKYDVFERFKSSAVGIDQDLVIVLPQSDPSLTARVPVDHCRRPRYLESLVRGGERFDLNDRFKGEVSSEEQTTAQQHPTVQQGLAAQAMRKTTAQEEQPETISAAGVPPAESEAPVV